MSRHRTPSSWTPARRRVAIAAVLCLSLIPAALTASSVTASSTKTDAVKVIHPVTANDGGIILNLPGITAQKEEPKPHSFVEGGSAYFDDNGPVLNVNVATMTGTKYTGWVKIVAKFVPNQHGRGSHPEITVTGDKNNMDVSLEKKSDGLPLLDVNFRNPQGNHGFVVDFNPDYGFMGGKFSYPEFYSKDFRNLSGTQCSVGTHTTNFRASGGGGIRWNTFNAFIGQTGNMAAFYTASSPEVTVQPGDNWIEEFGFQQGEPYAVTDYPNGWFEVGFDDHDLMAFGSSQDSTAKC